MATFAFTLVLLACTSSWTFAQEDLEFIDISDSPTVFTTTELPKDNSGTFVPRYMASVGNGHIATTVYTDTVFMNGLYNGDKGNSHRARIPSRNNIRVSVGTLVPQDVTFSLDVEKGVFFERFTVGSHEIEQRTFAHRRYHKVIVTQVLVKGAAGLTLTLSSNAGTPSEDITFGEPTSSTINGIITRSQCGQTKELEDEKYQKAFPTACVMSREVETTSIVTKENELRTYFAAYDFTQDGASGDFTEVAKIIAGGGDEEIYNSHVAAWTKVWDEGRIEVEGNLDLAKVIHGSFYYLLSSLPVTTGDTHSSVGQFYGLSPGGLAYGEHLRDYQGHSFWDTETWMYPPILYFFPKAAQQIINYRLHVLQAARDRATGSMYKGARYPWEGCVTGREVTPDCCPETRDFQIHITGDIAFSIRQYIATTRDLNWLTVKQSNYITNGCGMVREIAEFWASRVTYDNETRFHDIKHVMPPDEDHHDVDNNGYTNIQAAYSIFFAKYAECLCKSDMTAIPDEWVNIAKSLKLLYDEESDWHPEFEGYEIGTAIKQADVVLMGFPLLYNMKPSTRENDLHIYENVTRVDGPAMTWAMHTIGFLELDELDKAEQIFNNSYNWYVRQPYKVWTEAKPPTLGAINFITGMGGFLQSIVTGYGGYRLYTEKLVFSKPRLPPKTTSLKLIGLDYLENVFDVHITQQSVVLLMKQASTKYPLVIQQGTSSQEFVGDVTFNTATANVEFTITTTTATSCEVPLDQIGVPFDSASAALRTFYAAFYIALVAVLTFLPQ